MAEKEQEKKKAFVKKLLNLVSKEVGCSIQYGGCPCNTCFHNWAEKDLKLSPFMAHLFWLVVLGIRGDYPKKDIIEGLKEMKEIN